MLQNAVDGMGYSDEHAQNQDSEHRLHAEPGRQVPFNGPTPDRMPDEQPADGKQDQDQGAGAGKRDQHMFGPERSIYRLSAPISIPAAGTEEHEAKDGHDQRVQPEELAEVWVGIVRREVPFYRFPSDAANHDP